MLSWFACGLAVVLALAAWTRTGRLSRRLERLTRSYWDLRYEYAQVRNRVARLDPGGEVPAAPPQAGQAAFIPLSALKR